MPAATAGKLDVHVAVRAEERRLRCWSCHCGADCARPTRRRRPRTSLRLLATGTPCSPRLAAPRQTDAQFMERCLNGTKWWAALLLAPINGAVDLATQLFGNHPHMLNPGARGHVRRRRRGEGGPVHLRPNMGHVVCMRVCSVTSARLTRWWNAHSLKRCITKTHASGSCCATALPAPAASPPASCFEAWVTLGGR